MSDVVIVVTTSNLLVTRRTPGLLGVQELDKVLYDI
jgi:hypothetical protein